MQDFSPPGPALNTGYSPPVRTMPLAVRPSRSPGRTSTPVSVHALVPGTTSPGVEAQLGRDQPDVPWRLNACTRKHSRVPGVTANEAAATFPVVLRRAPPPQPSGGQLVLMWYPVTSAMLLAQVTSMWWRPFATAWTP